MIPFTELPETAYPFDIWLVYSDTGELTGHMHVPGPGLIKVPGQDQLQGLVDVVITYADGTVRASWD
jgi:hypothetical protein